MRTSHDWTESSGTTKTCRRCGLVRFSIGAKGIPVANTMAMNYVYGFDYAKSQPKEPPCNEAKP